MHGLVNQAIQGMVIENFGKDKWQLIKQRCGVIEDYFISDHPYEDEMTYELVGAASEVLQIPSEKILHDFGEYWILRTGYEKYGELMKAGGTDLYDFICNLPNFHGRIMLIYPNLSPPEFLVEKLSDHEIRLHYYSSRSGLTQFVLGLISGLSKMFDEPAEVKLENGDYDNIWHDVFHIRIGKN